MTNRNKKSIALVLCTFGASVSFGIWQQSYMAGLFIANVGFMILYLFDWDV